MITTFRLKIVLWYSAIVLVTLLVFRLVSVQVIRLSLDDDLDESLKAETVWLRNLLDAYKSRNIPDADIREDIEARSSLSPRKEFIEIYEASGNEYFRSPNLENDRLQNLGKRNYSIPVTIENFRGQSLRLFTTKDDSYEIYIAYPLTDVNAAIEQIIASFLFLIPIALLLSLIGGLFLLSRFMQPIKELNRYANKLMHAPLDHNLPKISVNTQDELGNLIRKINEVVEKMRGSMRQVLSFSSLASHELRTPLAIMRNQLEDTLHPKMPIAEVRKTVASLYDEVLRMNHIVDDLLNLATMQAGTFKMDRKRLEFHTLLAEFYEEARMLAKEKRVAVEYKRGPEVFIQADFVRLRQVLFNLLDNAIKHTPERGAIKIDYQVSGNEIIFHFADNGSGITPGRLSKITTLFAGSAEHYSLPGAGLGLALVRWIIAEHGGSINVESKVGRGTAFVIFLPVTES